MFFKLAATAAVLMTSTGLALADTPIGDWLVEDGSARIRIVECGASLWGLMAAEKQPSRDNNNPDPKLKGRPMLGVPMLLNLKHTEPNLWTGKIYDPIGTKVTSGGKYYDVKVSLGKKGQLEVRGCVGAIFCGGQDWTRVTDPNTPPVPPENSIFGHKAETAAETKMSKSSPRPAAPPVDPVCAAATGTPYR
jgi:uncharacterized protein (DUF2147 family)